MSKQLSPNQLQEVALSRSDLVELLGEDREFFINFFLAEEISRDDGTDVPQFHIDVFDRMVDSRVEQFACAIPRDHAKTTLAKLAVLYYFLYTKYSFIVYLSNTSGIATSAVNDIVDFMHSENFKQVFGEVEFSMEQAGKGFYQFVLFPGTPKEKKCILRALGAGQQVRGINVKNRRPQLAVVDDLEDNDNIATEELFLKLKKWVYGPFKKCLDKFGHKIIWLGNMISNRCMLKENCESPYWTSMRYGALLSNGEPLWKDVWTIDKLKQDYEEYQSAGMADIWFAEMMNMPIALGNGLIKPDEIWYKPRVEPGEPAAVCITIDPAISAREWGHKTALVVHGYMDGYWQTVDYAFDKGVDPITMFDTMLELAYKWGANVVGIEAVAYQKALKPFFEHLCLERRIENMEFVDLAASASKNERLAVWASMIKGKQYALTEGEYNQTEELLHYDPTKKENDCDIIDATAYIPQMVERYLDKIFATFSPHYDTEDMRTGLGAISAW